MDEFSGSGMREGSGRKGLRGGVAVRMVRKKEDFRCGGGGGSGPGGRGRYGSGEGENRELVIGSSWAYRRLHAAWKSGAERESGIMACGVVDGARGRGVVDPDGGSVYGLGWQMQLQGLTQDGLIGGVWQGEVIELLIVNEWEGMARRKEGPDDSWVDSEG